MGFNHQVRLPSGEMRPVADNQIPYHLNCPIDGTQLTERTEYDHTGYDCVTCKTSYHVRWGKIDEGQWQKLARFELENARIKLNMIEKEKGKLLSILELARANNFPLD